MYVPAVLYLLFSSLTVAEAMRRVLHLKMVTQCAMLEEFGIFLVLADKVRHPSSDSPHVNMC